MDRSWIRTKNRVKFYYLGRLLEGTIIKSNLRFVVFENLVDDNLKPVDIDEIEISMILNPSIVGYN